MIMAGTAAAMPLCMTYSIGKKSSTLVLTTFVATVFAFAVPGCAADTGTEESNVNDTNELGSDAEELKGSYAVGVSLITLDALNLRESNSVTATVLAVIPEGTIVKSASASPRGDWYGVTYGGKTGWVHGAFLAVPDAAAKQSIPGDAATIMEEYKAGKISLYETTFGRVDGADALSNIRDTAAGKRARRSVHANAPGGSIQLTPKLLAAMVKLRKEYNFTYRVTAIAGASHSVGSAHYAGRAFDIGTVNGVLIKGNSSAANNFMSACRKLGATQVFGPSNDPVGHNDHLHCSF
jgi:uncharacterized protein YgiM (DUF1202 family)